MNVCKQQEKKQKQFDPPQNVMILRFFLQHIPGVFGQKFDIFETEYFVGIKTF